MKVKGSGRPYVSDRHRRVRRHSRTDCSPTTTGVNTAGDAGDTSPPIFWLVGTSMGISPPIFLRTFGYSRQFIPYISRPMFDKADFLRP